MEVAEAVGGFTALTPSGTSVLLEGQLAKAPENAKQVPQTCGSRPFPLDHAFDAFASTNAELPHGGWFLS